MIEPHRPPADGRDVIQRVGAEQDGSSITLKLPDLVDAFFLEVTIADGKSLIDHQDVGIDIASRMYMPDE